MDSILHRLTVALLDTHREETDAQSCLSVERAEVAFILFRNIAKRHQEAVIRFVVCIGRTVVTVGSYLPVLGHMLKGRAYTVHSVFELRKYDMMFVHLQCIVDELRPLIFRSGLRST